VAIRVVQVRDINEAAADNAYAFSNVEVTGNTATWDQRWRNRNGDRFCRQGQSAVVEDGRIVSWTWGGDGGCP
jgi:hypothetical protein